MGSGKLLVEMVEIGSSLIGPVRQGRVGESSAARNAEKAMASVSGTTVLIALGVALVQRWDELHNDSAEERRLDGRRRRGVIKKRTTYSPGRLS